MISTLILAPLSVGQIIGITAGGVTIAVLTVVFALILLVSIYARPKKSSKSDSIWVKSQAERTWVRGKADSEVVDKRTILNQKLVVKKVQWSHASIRAPSVAIILYI